MNVGARSGVLVEADAPAAAEDAVVPLDQFREGVPGRLVERLDRALGHQAREM
jgi:hypothetical protein